MQRLLPLCVIKKAETAITSHHAKLKGNMILLTAQVTNK
jgi:hypothetical protein